MRKFGKYIAFNVSRLENCGDEPTPSQHKYRKNFKLNNCANEDFPQAQPLMQTAVKCSIIFSRTEKINTTFIRNVWFSVSNITQSFRLRIVSKLLKSENCL